MGVFKRKLPGLSSWQSGELDWEIPQSTVAGTFLPWGWGGGAAGNALGVFESLHPESRNLLNTFAGEGVILSTEC